MADNAKAKRILIVEDDDMLRKALILKLTNAGFAVDYAENGEEALAQLGEKKFDLILLDFVMPRMDGFTFLKELRLREIATPVIGLSNLAQNEDIEKASELGVTKYITKSGEPITKVAEEVKRILANGA